jgi:Tfp pilus assembly protein PilF
MAKTTNYLKKCEKISKITLYLLVFLLPLFFLPWTSNVLNFNKQALLVFLVFISSFAWLLRILISGRFSFSFSWLHIPLLVFFLVFLLSTLFSLYPYGSFWGWPLSVGASFLTVLCFVLLYFLITNIFNKEEVFHLIIYLIFSSFLALLFGAFQLFGKFIFPFAFSKSPAFNTIGSTGSLAVLAAVFLPLLTLLIIKTKKKLLKIFFGTAIFLDIFLLVLINFFIAWWLVIISAVLTITLIAQKRDIIDNRWLILPMFFLAIALLFVFLKFRLPGTPRFPSEVFLNQKASANIAWQALKEKPVFGSGPGTFLSDFTKHKDAGFNKSQLWNIRFNKAGSEFFNVLSTTGLLGAFSFLVLIGLFIFLAVRVLFIERKKEKKQGLARAKKTAEEDAKEENGEFFWVLAAGLLVSFLVLTAGFFLYNFNFSLYFVYFFFLAAFLALASSKQEFSLRPSSLSTLIFTFMFTLFFVFGLGIFILEAQRYAAAVDYQKGLDAWRKGDTKEAVSYVEKAARINAKVDLYWRQLSQFYIQRLKEVARDKSLSEDEANRWIQLYINNSVNSAKAAVEANPYNVANWSVRAYTYQNLIGMVGGVEDWAAKSYQSALNLEPLNPYFPTQEGLVYVQQASLLPRDKKSEKIKILEKAKGRFEKAIELKSDYAPAHFQLAMVYQAEGKAKEAIERLEATKRIAPFDIGLAFQLGLTYYQNKNYQKAKTEFERAVSINSNYSNALYFLGLVYNKLGLVSKAIEQFEKVAELNPDNRQVEKILENLKSGKNIFEGLVQKQPPEVPIKENQPSNK